MLLLLCNCLVVHLFIVGCTMAEEQQHETVTTITTERNQHKLLSIGELRFEIDVRSDGPPVVVVHVLVLQLSLGMCNYR